MDALLNIPILGWILELILYVINHLQFLGPQTLQLATPIALGALCGVMCERSGVVNIAIEGLMLTAAFVGFMVAMLVSQAMPDATPSSIFGATPALVIGVIAAVLAGMLVSALHAWLSVSVQANQIISGTAINILALGLTSYLNRLIKPSGERRLLRLVPPALVAHRPAARRLALQHVPLGRPDHDVGDRVRRRDADLAVPVSLGPPDAGRRRAPPRGRHGRRERHRPALQERDPRRHLRRPRRRVARRSSSTPRSRTA